MEQNYSKMGITLLQEDKLKEVKQQLKNYLPGILDGYESGMAHLDSGDFVVHLKRFGPCLQKYLEAETSVKILTDSKVDSFKLSEDGQRV